MSANWSFFLFSGLKRTIFLYRNSVKRSRHNVWTLCINLIELQLFCDDFGEHQTSKSRRNDHTSSDSFFLSLYPIYSIRAHTFELAFQIVVPVLLENCVRERAICLTWHRIQSFFGGLIQTHTQIAEQFPIMYIIIP